MKKSHYLFLVTIMITCSLNAQRNFKHGYVITNNNDTITGWIDFRTSTLNSKICHFKQNETDKLTRYYPNDIVGYRFIDEGKFYVSHTINIEGKDEAVFLEYLLKGIVDLYYYVGNNNTQYYIFKDRVGKITILDRKEDFIVFNERLQKNISKTDNSYIGKLKLLFQDSPSTIDKIDKKIEFTQDDIISITKYYHDNMCPSDDKCILFETKKDKNIFIKTISVYGGIQSASLEFGNKGFIDLSDYPSIKGWYPLIGAQISICKPRLSKSMSAFFETSISYISGNVSLENSYNKSIISFKTIVSNNKLGLKYTYQKTKIRPTIEAAINYILLVGSSGSREMIYNATQNRDKIDLTKETLPQGSYFGYYGAIGADYLIKNQHVIFLRIGYEKNHSLINDKDEFSRQLESFSLRVGYSL